LIPRLLLLLTHNDKLAQQCFTTSSNYIRFHNAMALCRVPPTVFAWQICVALSTVAVSNSDQRVDWANDIANVVVRLSLVYPFFLLLA
jgi:hypothetical protein